jgi:hypothetical protein
VGDTIVNVAITTVGSKGSEDSTKNESRLKAGKLAMVKAKSLGSDILVLPAGFLVSDDSKSMQIMADILIDEAQCLELAVVFGVNDCEVQLSYGYAWNPLEGKKSTWKQLSSTCKDWRELPEGFTKDQWEAQLKGYIDTRLLAINGGVVGVLLCGELFNEHLRNALGNKKPTIIVDLVHRGSGFRSTGAMKKICREGIAVACSAHVQKGNAMKRCYIPCNGDDGNVSTRDSDTVIKGPPKIELKLFIIS